MAAQVKLKCSRSDEEWLGLFSIFKDSGIGVRAFCKHHGIAVASFYAKRRLLIEIEEQPVNPFVAIKLRDDELVCRSESSRISSALRINFASGISIEFLKGCQTDEIKALAEVLT